MLVNGSTNRHVIKYKGILSNFNMHKWHYLQSLLSKHKFITLWYDNDKIVTVRHKNKKFSSLHSSLSFRVSRTRSPVWEWKLLKCGTGTLKDGTQRYYVFSLDTLSCTSIHDARYYCTVYIVLEPQVFIWLIIYCSVSPAKSHFFWDIDVFPFLWYGSLTQDIKLLKCFRWFKVHKKQSIWCQRINHK